MEWEHDFTPAPVAVRRRRRPALAGPGVWRRRRTPTGDLREFPDHQWGGVAANLFLNGLIKDFIKEKNINYHQVPLSLCTDNAAMIGWNAIEVMRYGKTKLNNYNIRPTPNILLNENF